MVFEDRENSFLDNIIKGASNEQLFALEKQRKPASESEPTNVQTMPTEHVEGDGDIKPFELPDGVKPTSPEQQVRLKINNDALIPKIQAKVDLGYNYQDATKNVGTLKEQMQGNLSDLKNTAGEGYTVDPDLQRRIDMAYNDVGAAKIPEHDMWSQAILSFAPALFGSLTGESGAISQLEGGKQARKIYDDGRKEDIATANNRNAIAEKRYLALLKIKNSGETSFTKAQQLEMERQKAIISGTGDLLKAGITDQGKTQDAYLKQGDDVSKGLLDAGEKYAKGEEAAKDREARLKAAKLMAANSGARLAIPTDGERKASMQASGMLQAEKNMTGLIAKNKGTYPSTSEKFFKMQKEIMSGSFGDMTLSQLMNSPKIDGPTRQQIQIERSFLEGIGRINSGAAVSLAEWQNFREQYFPNFGDDPQTIAQKEQQRKTAMAGVKVMAGRSAKDIIPPVDVVSKPQAPQPGELTREQKIEALKAHKASKQKPQGH